MGVGWGGERLAGTEPSWGGAPAGQVPSAKASEAGEWREALRWLHVLTEPHPVHRGRMLSTVCFWGIGVRVL